MMRLVIRLDDQVSPHDDLVLRAGGGDIDALTQSALENARDYEPLVVEGLIKSPFTISVHIPRSGIAEYNEIIGSPAYLRYKPYLQADASSVLALSFVDIVATTPIEDSVDPGRLDLCHFDIVIEASSHAELRARVAEVRTLFTKIPNPLRFGTLPEEGDANA
jgi:hypothetical protein